MALSINSWILPSIEIQDYKHGSDMNHDMEVGSRSNVGQVIKFETYHHTPTDRNVIIGIISDKLHKIRVFFDITHQKTLEQTHKKSLTSSLRSLISITRFRFDFLYPTLGSYHSSHDPDVASYFTGWEPRTAPYTSRWGEAPELIIRALEWEELQGSKSEPVYWENTSWVTVGGDRSRSDSRGGGGGGGGRETRSRSRMSPDIEPSSSLDPLDIVRNWWKENDPVQIARVLNLPSAGGGVLGQLSSVKEEEGARIPKRTQYQRQNQILPTQNEGPSQSDHSENHAYQSENEDEDEDRLARDRETRPIQSSIHHGHVHVQVPVPVPVPATAPDLTPTFLPNQVHQRQHNLRSSSPPTTPTSTTRNPHAETLLDPFCDPMFVLNYIAEDLRNGKSNDWSHKVAGGEQGERDTKQVLEAIKLFDLDITKRDDEGNPLPDELINLWLIEPESTSPTMEQDQNEERRGLVGSTMGQTSQEEREGSEELRNDVQSEVGSVSNVSWASSPQRPVDDQIEKMVEEKSLTATEVDSLPVAEVEDEYSSELSNMMANARRKSPEKIYNLASPPSTRSEIRTMTPEAVTDNPGRRPAPENLGETFPVTSSQQSMRPTWAGHDGEDASGPSQKETTLSPIPQHVASQSNRSSADAPGSSRTATQDRDTVAQNRTPPTKPDGAVYEDKEEDELQQSTGTPCRVNQSNSQIFPGSHTPEVPQSPMAINSSAPKTFVLVEASDESQSQSQKTHALAESRKRKLEVEDLTFTAPSVQQISTRKSMAKHSQTAIERATASTACETSLVSSTKQPGARPVRLPSPLDTNNGSGVAETPVKDNQSPRPSPSLSSLSERKAVKLEQDSCPPIKRIKRIILELRPGSPALTNAYVHGIHVPT